jgi:hypothetical protein
MEVKLESSEAVGSLGVQHLKRLWSRCLLDRSGRRSEIDLSHEWRLDNVIYHGLDLPIEETIHYLYQESPSFDDFEIWILNRNGGAIDRARIERINATIQRTISGDSAGGSVEEIDEILDDDQIELWKKDGYLVVPGLFSDDEISAANEAVWEYLGIDRDVSETWYREQSDHGIMVQLFHHPSLDAIRNSEAVRRVFAQLWNTNDLWRSTDRVSFNPPETDTYKFRGPRLHWDVSLELPIPFGVQGLIYLTDTPADRGAFTCIPGFHTRIESWLNELPPGADPRDQDLENLGARPIEGKAGDLVVWHQALPHGSSPNRSSSPRIVQYVTMFPAEAEYADNWR